MYCFGRGRYGALGTGNETDVSYTHPVENNFFEKRKLTIKEMAIGEHHNAVLTHNGDIYTWGFGGRSTGFSFAKLFSGACSPLGHGNDDNRLVPRRVEYFVKNKLKGLQIAVGRYHSAALTDNNQVYIWGKGDYGVLGLGGSRSHTAPVHIANLCAKTQTTDADTVIKIDAADYFTAALTSNLPFRTGVEGGDVYVWGSNDEGQLGIGDGSGYRMFECEPRPVPIQFEKPVKIVDLRCGEGTLILKDEEGKIYMAGLKLHYNPTVLEIPSQFSLSKNKQIFCGRSHFTLLDGKLDLISKTTTNS